MACPCRLYDNATDPRWPGGHDFGDFVYEELLDFGWGGALSEDGTVAYLPGTSGDPDFDFNRILYALDLDTLAPSSGPGPVTSTVYDTGSASTFLTFVTSGPGDTLWAVEEEDVVDGTTVHRIIEVVGGVASTVVSTTQPDSDDQVEDTWYPRGWGALYYHPVDGNLYTLRRSFRDNSGTGNGTSSRTELCRLDPDTGSITVLETLIRDVNVNAFTGGTVSGDATEFVHDEGWWAPTLDGALWLQVEHFSPYGTPPTPLDGLEVPDAQVRRYDISTGAVTDTYDVRLPDDALLPGADANDSVVGWVTDNAPDGTGLYRFDPDGMTLLDCTRPINPYLWNVDQSRIISGGHGSYRPLWDWTGECPQHPWTTGRIRWGPTAGAWH